MLDTQSPEHSPCIRLREAMGPGAQGEVQRQGLTNRTRGLWSPGGGSSDREPRNSLPPGTPNSLLEKDGAAGTFTGVA